MPGSSIITALQILSCGVFISCRLQGPFDTFLVGGDTAEVSGMKFSNDGKVMLLSTTSNRIYVLDAYSGNQVRGAMEFALFPFSPLFRWSLKELLRLADEKKACYSHGHFSPLQ